MSLIIECSPAGVSNKHCLLSLFSLLIDYCALNIFRSRKPSAFNLIKGKYFFSTLKSPYMQGKGRSFVEYLKTICIVVCEQQKTLT